MMRLFLLFLLLVIGLPASAASPVKARPPSGIGLLLVRDGAKPLIVYREPKLGRLAEIPPAQLPGLAPSLYPFDGLFPAVVLSRRPGWLRILYDSSESDGWVERRSGEFQPWEQFLPGRAVRMVAGLRQEYYQLRSQAFFGAESLRSLGQDERLAVVAVAGDWLKVNDGAAVGWLRWRDENSRLAIAVLPADRGLVLQ